MTFSTHEVFNQPPPFEDVNLYGSDAALKEAVAREGGGGAASALVAFGKCGSAQAFERGPARQREPAAAQDARPPGPAPRPRRLPPRLSRLHGAELRGGAALLGLAAPRRRRARAAARCQRGARRRFYMAAQMEAGHCCPGDDDERRRRHAAPGAELEAWLPLILARALRPEPFPPATSAATIGMGMTEKQGGTDVRANTTQAAPIAAGGPGAEYILVGHKWFMSAPMSDAFLVLAQAPAGLTCFLLPRFLPDGAVNALSFQRLKDKLGNRSNASSEVEFAGAHGWAIGEEGRGRTDHRDGDG